MKAKAILASVILAVGVYVSFQAGCGPKQGKTKGSESPDKKGKDKKGQDRLADAVDQLNQFIQEGNEKETEALVAESTLNLLVDVVAFSPEETGGGIPSPGAADLLDFEKQNDVEYSLAGIDEETGEQVLAITVAGEKITEGPVELMDEEGKSILVFDEVAQMWLEKVQSEGILRGKYIQVADKVNEAISEKDANALKDFITTDTLNQELKVRSYSVKFKKGLSLQTIVNDWNKKNVTFEVTNVAIDDPSGDLKVLTPDGVIYEGRCKFITEIGKLKIDFQDILNEKIEELEAEVAEQKGKKKKKKK